MLNWILRAMFYIPALFLDVTGNAIVVYSLDGTVMDWNPAAEQNWLCC